MIGRLITSMSLGRRSVHDSVTRVPPSAGSNLYSHREMSNGPAFTSNTNDLPGAAATTLQTVDHFRHPLWLRPLNRAPTTGCLVSPTHSHPTVSGDHSPMRVPSGTRAHHASGAG